MCRLTGEKAHKFITSIRTSQKNVLLGKNNPMISGSLSTLLHGKEVSRSCRSILKKSRCFRVDEWG
jgi:hypothetical protein